MALNLRDKRLMDLARSGDFEAALKFIEDRKIRSLDTLVGLLHPLKDMNTWQFDVYADAWRAARELKTLCPPT